MTKTAKKHIKNVNIKPTLFAMVAIWLLNCSSVNPSLAASEAEESAPFVLVSLFDVDSSDSQGSSFEESEERETMVRLEAFKLPFM